jgi:hypothetical protein
MVNKKIHIFFFLIKQLWFNQIEIDIVILLNAYFSSQLSLLTQISATTRTNYLKNAKEFLSFAQVFLNKPNDVDLRMRERTMIVSVTQENIFFYNLTI